MLRRQSDVRDATRKQRHVSYPTVVSDAWERSVVVIAEMRAGTWLAIAAMAQQRIGCWCLAPAQVMHCVRGTRSLCLAPRMSREENEQREFLRKPEFDLVSLRSWRRETLVRYASANQSEPLRILLWLTLCLTLFFSKAIAEAVGAADPEPVGAYYLGSLASFALLNRERNRRTRQLLRLEREQQVADLEVTLSLNPTLPGAKRTYSLRSLRGEYRLVGVYTSSWADFEAIDRSRRALARRLAASRVLVVAVPPQGTSKTYELASPSDTNQWRTAFAALLQTDTVWGDFDFETREAAWFGLAFSGRSVASGTGLPDLFELLGSVFPPTNFLEPNPPLDPPPTALLERQLAFYDVLRTGTPDDMVALFDETRLSPTVTRALARDPPARIDDWSKQLAPSARPVDLSVGDADATVFEDDAFTTAVEEIEGRQTLLALQTWRRATDDWLLVSHETVPFAPQTTAAALLRCDKRGCVAFVSGSVSGLNG